MTRFRRILMATDFSPASEAAFEEAVSLARESGAALTILHVYETPAGAAVPYLPVEGYLESLVAARTEAEGRMRHLLSRDALRGLDVRAEVTKGLPGTHIVETATREKADLIVMGTHGRRGVARLLLGSVAAMVIAVAPCPVLTIRVPSARDRTATVPAA
jgi:nucleotide-binding universal stress UspA family protein